MAASIFFKYIISFEDSILKELNILSKPYRTLLDFCLTNSDIITMNVESNGVLTSPSFSLDRHDAI